MAERRRQAVARVVGVVGLLLLAGTLGCRMMGIPRLALEEASPSGGYLAQVRNEMSLDPPPQSLWIVSGDGSDATRVLQLAEDQDWCDQISWSADGSTVAFVIQRAWIAVYDAQSRELRAREWLAEPGDYPPRDELRELRLSENGTVVSYRLCGRGTGECSDTRESRIL